MLTDKYRFDEYRFVELIVICVDDAVRRRGYCDHFVTMCVCVCEDGCVCYHDKTKTADRNDLKLDTVIDLNTASKFIDLGFKRSIFLSASNNSNPNPGEL